jgi:UDP-2,4-diacetamido-2,4,6-trideoxy-beta-L-altropyranose hydrolase
MKKVVFRVDASKKIGAGHLMRCIALASEIMQTKVEIFFLTRNIPKSYLNLLIAMGITCLELCSRSDGVSDDQWLAVSQDEDANECMSILDRLECDLLVVDHYGLDRCWEQRMRPFTKKILVIDDLADRLHACDFLLDQNYYIDMSKRYVDKVPAECTLLLGPEFALLKREFRVMHKNILPRRSIKTILVSLGGVDANNFTATTILAIAKFGIDKFAVDVVIGTEHPIPELIVSMCEKYKFNIHIQTEEMAQLMARADLAIGASGTTTWERCCLGLPSIVVALAENQVKIARDIHTYGAAIYIGEEKDVSVDLIFDAIGKMCTDDYKVWKLSEAAFTLVDGMGTARVIDKIGIVNENFYTLH